VTDVLREQLTAYDEFAADFKCACRSNFVRCVVISGPAAGMPFFKCARNARVRTGEQPLCTYAVPTSSAVMGYYTG
jgi:hypothetical protein